MNSINWPAHNVWVFIAQRVEHCSANAEAMSSNPVEARIFFFWGGGGGGEAGESYLLFRKSQLITNATIISSFKICTSAVHIIFINKVN